MFNLGKWPDGKSVTLQTVAVVNDFNGLPSTFDVLGEILLSMLLKALAPMLQSPNVMSGVRDTATQLPLSAMLCEHLSS